VAFAVRHDGPGECGDGLGQVDGNAPEVETNFALLFSHDGALLFSGSVDGAVVWDVAGGRRRDDLLGHTGGVAGLGFSPDDRTLYTTTARGALLTWDLARGDVFGELPYRKTCPAN
jgi:WD40 repeat protein